MSAGTDSAEILRQRDAEARSLAQREFRAPLVLEAGAGTGKTATLVARILAWSLGPGWQRAAAQLGERGGVASSAPERIAERVLGRVVAITFTEAAAAEMATRVDAALRLLEAGSLPIGADDEALPEPGLRAARARALRGALDHLIVQTIHAYCRRLLAAHPLDAGVHPRLEVDAEGREQTAVVRDVVERRLREAYALPGDAAALRLAADGFGPLELERELAALLEQGVSAAELARDPFEPARVRAAWERLRAALDAFRAVAGERLRSVRRGDVALEVAEALERAHAELAQPPQNAAALDARAGELRALWSERARERLRKWSRDDLTASERQAIEPGVDCFCAASAPLAAALDHWTGLDVPRFEAAQRVLGELLAEVEETLRRRGSASFSRLLSAAADLVTRSASVAARVRRGIDQLLVDEFQDTDRRQCAIVGALALEGPEEERPGLFLVGDPKQSIYGWRSADLSAYEAFVARVGDAGGAVHPLAVNFRSVPAILDEVERVVAPVMQRAPGLQPEFQALVACPALANASRDAGFAPIEYWISAEVEDGAARQTSSAQASALEARALAADLRALHAEQGMPWQEIAILFRSRGDWDLYLAALREAGIPFAVQGDRSHYRRREIIDAAALVRCVLDPNDHLALLTLLRSSAVGVPDAALLPLWSIGLPALFGALGAVDAQAQRTLHEGLPEVLRALPEDVPGLERVRGWEQNLLHAAEAIAALRDAFERDAPDVFVERLRSTLLLEASEAARFLGAWRVANLERFFRMLAEELALGADTGSVLRRLRSAVAEEEPAEEGQPRDLTPDAVRVLTLHGAKGLDFDCVYLMQLHRASGSRAARQCEAREHDGQLELRLLGAASLGWDLAQRARERVAEAEHVRTLYVGMTRARKRLVLAGLWPDFQTRSSERNHVTLLGARRVPPPDLPQLFADCVGQGAAALDTCAARWRFPALDAARAAPPARTAPEAPDLERVRADAEALHRARAQAEARMRRPLLATASAEAHAAPASERPPGAAALADGLCARLAGSAVHRVLECFDLDAEPAAELARQRAGLALLLRPLAPAARLDEVVREAQERLDRLARGHLLATLRALRDHIVARELPVLLAAQPDDEPLALFSGSIDLVYRDPESGAFVVVDYKTDRVADDAELAARTRSYARQGAVYQRAVAAALGLDALPRFELWYLSADRRVDASAPAAAPAAPSDRS
ncbi:MAG: UvrD-helicase domain-containing protein [Myxococcales bacterium]|nr:UvrD-helicase domain-containing protein [Myxococcales bacterium]MDH5305914.1 UvrD-helicase domain-containing protein [Myxococcales bacterium]MDH5565052.1 UvrD-helicase domain-containing protein [Myxococcales bacterium]